MNTSIAPSTDPPATDPPVASRTRRATVVGAVITLIAAVLPALAISSPAQAAGQTVISLTFDDGNADQLPAASAMAARGMHGTFFVNSGTIGQSGFMTRANLEALAAAGHEIAGHTVNHPSLPSLPETEAKRQICLDRNNLIDWGFNARSFAYPFAETSAALQALVKQCGYNSARNLGDLKTRFGGTDGLYAETTPPPNAYETRALDQVDSTWALQDFKDAVTNAESHDGGWVQFTFHNICTTTCGDLAVTQTQLNQFLDWLDQREATQNTVVKTVGDVIGGTTKPKVVVADPPPPTDNTGLTNPGFETISSSGVPECWMKGGFGSNTALFDTVTPGHAGERAGRLTVTDYADGDAKLLPALDLGTCAPGASSGKAYNLTAWYTSTANTQFDVYLRDSTGSWIYWDSSPWFGPTSEWTLASWTTGVVPEGYTGISFGLNLFSNGVLTVDDYGITVGTATAPTTTATVTPAAPNGAGGWYTTTPDVALSRTAAAGWTIQYSLDGTTWLPYTAPFPVPNGVTTVLYRSKGAGDYAETTRTLTLKVDTAKPTVTAAFDAATRKLTATASDATPGSGIAKIETSTNGGTTWTTYPGAITVPDAATSTTYQVRATDAAGNVSAIATQVVPPELKTSATIAPAQPDGENGWYDTTPTITVTRLGATPAAEYSWNGQDWTAYTAPVAVADGTRTFRYRGVSGAEKGAINQLEVKADTVKPTVTASFDKSSRTLTATGDDASSGIARIEISRNGGTSWTTFTSPTTLSDDAASLQLRAVDRAGHVSATQAIAVKARQATASVAVVVTSPRTFGKAAAARIVVTGDADLPTPTGTVTVLVDGRPVGSTSLSGGATTVLLPAELRAGSHTVSATYAGDAETKPATSAGAALTVQRALPTVSVKPRSSRISKGSRPRVTATVTVPGTAVRPTGRVAVRVDGKVVKRETLRASDRGKLSIRLPRISRTGTHRVTVTFEGSSDIRSRTSSTRTIRVR
ncbi:MAG: hypothetical protein JWR55_1650 [Aeromicrobium sp.]|nr:hypothetical protein [Aeromicrobium sp.]